MRWRDPRWILALASLALVLALFLLDYERTSPGPLSAAHASAPELAGSEGCDACHGDFGARFVDTCAECHATVATQVAERTGLHGALAARGASVDCALCHSEHHGAELDLVGEAAFALAGFGARADFAHGHTDFALVGVHADLACTACHAHADAPLPPEGALRFGGLAQACSTCHDDPHAGRYGAGCADCHGQTQPFDALDGFVHERGLALRGAHVGVACEACHAPGSERSVAALAGGASGIAPRACQDCHASSHEPELLAGTAARADVAPGATCAVCHDEEHATFAAGERAMPRALHDLVGMQLDGPHVRVDCASCHAGGLTRAPDRPARLGSDCAACHDDPHAGQFGARACLDCHERERFTPSRIDVAAHAASGFALSGAHATTACAACHTPATGAASVRTFRGTPSDCAACHPNQHEGVLGGPIAAAGADCAACHLPTTFAEVDPATFDHGHWTAFALLGRHDEASCEACHGSGAPARRLGRVSERTAGSLELCASCHADVHRGAFVENDCAACHTPHGFADEELRAGFAHGAHTGFELQGAHARLGCAACHGAALPAVASSTARLAHARSFGFASDHAAGDPATCAGCHADPHLGRFEEAMALDPRDERASCAACHTLEAFAGSAAEGFDHGRWAAFALDGAHAELACAACHAPTAEPMAGMGELGLAAGRTCAACHADPHAGQFTSSGRNDCARCHDTAPGFGVPRFDHARDSRFALDERHADLACNACHVPWPVEGLGEVVRFKPLGTRCIDCHDHGGGGGG